MNGQLLREVLLLGSILFTLFRPALSAADERAGDTVNEPVPVSSQQDATTQDFESTNTANPLQQDENHWRLRFNLAWVNPTGSSISTSFGDNSIGFDLGAGAGAGFQAEYRASPRFGIELGILGAAEFDISNRISRGQFRHDVGISGFAPLSLGFNFHLTPEKSFDLYAGPLFALVNYGSEQAWWDLGTRGNRISIESDRAWGLAAGLDIPLGKRGWLFNTNLRYLDSSIEQSRGDYFVNDEFNPVIFSIGIGYAF